VRNLLSPLRLGPAELQNRIVSTAHQTTLIRDHLPTDEFVGYHEARAAGGAGLIVLEAAAVHPSGLLTDKTLGIFDQVAVPALVRVAEAVHVHGTRLFVQLFHGGREQIMSPPRQPAVAPSAVPTPRFHVEPRALGGHEVEEIIAGYGKGAAIAAAAGLDGVEISAAHNYLIAEFFSPETNHRTDEWADGRLFLAAVLSSVREAAPELAVGVRVSADAAVAGAIVEQLAERADYVSFALGDASTLPGAVGIVPPPPVPHNAIADAADRHRPALPRIVTSRIVEPAEAEALIASGHGDAVGMTRALIVDPGMPLKLRSGREHELLRCIGCNVCIAHYHAGTPIACAQNPRTGRERELSPPEPAAERARVVVIGAGPAGLAATREAALRGHEVVVFERDEEVGGQVRLMRDAPGQAEIAETLVRNYDETLRSPHVELRIGTEADVDRISPLAPNLVVVATGAEPYRAPIPADGIEPLEAWDVLRGTRPRGRVLVADWGGDPSGLDCAELLAGAGCDVTLAVAATAVGESLHSYRRALYLARLYAARVRIRHHLRLVEATPEGGVFANLFAGDIRELIHADHVVLAQGRVPAANPFAELRESGLEVRRVGDCASPRSLEEAILEGTMAVVAWAEGAGGRHAPAVQTA
jgi:2,4-dienoyl-CoA reductase-like NADH-dependent reductase (Old Yellow Enzyme family)/NADPH-dependent 2,4-dienoyl-CoA reductase/sulfur reductase-like enzyme